MTITVIFSSFVLFPLVVMAYQSGWCVNNGTKQDIQILVSQGKTIKTERGDIEKVQDALNTEENILKQTNARLEAVAVSAGTIRNIWIKEDLETRYKRLLRLEEEKNGMEIELTEERIRLLEKANPCFRERNVESPYPGYLLSQDTFMVGTIKGVGRIYLQAVVDTYGSFAFGKLYTSKLPETAADVLYDRVLPFYESQGITVENILTDNGWEYCGRPMIHPYQIFLELNDIEHRRTKVARPRTNGFVERFNRTVLDEFFRETFHDKFYASVEELQEDLDQWLHYYNYERPHRGYRNMGGRSIETMENGKIIKEQLTIKQVA
jgi:transposase InsO family protein